MAINNVALVGRLTKDPSLKIINNNLSTSTFTLAINKNFVSADGQKADFINCVAWNKTAENIDKYCYKGQLIGVIGRLQSRTYDNTHGQKVYVVEVVCNTVHFIESKSSNKVDNKTDNSITMTAIDANDIEELAF
jgi:single-strand DNA-binding protein